MASGKRGYATDLSDAQWAVLEPELPKQTGAGRRRTVALRRVLDALFYLDRTGCQWRLVPKDFPNWNTVRYYFDKWRDDGTWERLNDRLREATREKAGRHRQPSAGAIDSQSVKTTEAGGERGFDGGKKDQRAQAPYRGGYARPPHPGAGARGGHR